MTMETPVKTAKVRQRRTIHFNSLDEYLAEADRLADAETDGKLQLTGNWTLGQIFNHLATWIDYSYDGAPIKIPWLMRQILRPLKNRILTKSMRAGSRIPGVADGTLATNVVPTAEALAHLHRNIDRLKASSPTSPSPLFGPLTHEEWIKLHLRHAELHLSFVAIS
jgi:Protein of unknown function (DUF1569)